MKLGTILVPLDGSALAETALPKAVELALNGNSCGVVVGLRVAPHAAPERAGAVGPLRPPAGDEDSGRGRTGDEPARERGKAATGPAAPRAPRSFAVQG